MIKHFFLIAVVTIVAFGCSRSRVAQDTPKANSVVANNQNTCITSDFAGTGTVPKIDYWSNCFEHSIQSFEQRIRYLSDQAEQRGISDFEKIDSALYFLRAYAYLGDVENIADTSWLAFHTTLKTLAQASASAKPTPQSIRLWEHIISLQYLYYPNSHAKSVLASLLTQHLDFWQQVFEQSRQFPKNQQNDYLLLEFYRLIGFMSYHAVRDDNIKQALLKDNVMLDGVLSWLDLEQLSLWQLENILWVAGNLHVLLTGEQQQLLDDIVKERLFSTGLDEEIAKRYFSQIYLANSFRFKDDCQQRFAGFCDIPQLTQILPVVHECSSTVKIRATQMSADELNASCQGVLAQENFFHQQLATNKQPVADDTNKQLEVVIFDNYTEYNKWGQLVFNIFTNNGGMYIEGKPEQEGNQARFYSFEAFWKLDEFSVWNLQHEYVHYLDGRYVKYGGFGFYPEQLVWWSEGLAEYIAKPNDNKRALKELKETKVEDWPNLQAIFNTSYQDGSARVYQWSYWAQRFLFTQHNVAAQSLAKALKQKEFSSYQQQLTLLAESLDGNFKLWLVKQLSGEHEVKATEQNKSKPRYLYRYLYRDYLRPSHLPLSKDHFHFEYWG